MKRITKRITKHAPAAFILLLGCGWWLLTMATQRAPLTEERERGDVPGWVMITLMSAVLVAALLALATPALEGLFNQAIDMVGK